jgi:hypothetical protein
MSPKKQSTKAMQLLQNFLDRSASQPVQPPYFKCGKRLTPMSDTTKNKNIDIKEEEIEEQQVHKRRRIISVSVPEEARSILSSANQPMSVPLRPSKATRDSSAQIRKIRNKVPEFYTRQLVWKISLASDHQSCLISTGKSGKTADDAGMQSTTGEPAARDGLHCLIGPGMSATTTGKYCCWLYDCREEFVTPKELNEHVKHEHPDEHSAFVKAAISSDDGLS